VLAQNRFDRVAFAGVRLVILDSQKIDTLLVIPL